jgi:2-alkyl-3-oxoalkanoate reductase
MASFCSRVGTASLDGMAKRALVTGVSGFLGGALGRRLQAAGWEVVGISRRDGRPGSCDQYLRGDLSRMDLGSLGIFDAVVHCAALASPWAPVEEFARHNVEATRRILDFSVDKEVRSFVFVSSSSVHYDWADQWLIREDTPWPEEAINEYARTKRMAEALVSQSGLAWAIVRPRAIFGPGDTVLFPRILRAARTGSLPRLERPDGKSAIGDLIYIENLTEMIWRVLERGATGVYNLTNEEPVPIYEFLEGIFSELGYPPIRRRLGARWAFGLARGLEGVASMLGDRWEPSITRFGVATMVYSKTFDVSKARSDLGSVPISIGEGKRRFVEWQRTVSRC